MQCVESPRRRRSSMRTTDAAPIATQYSQKDAAVAFLRLASEGDVRRAFDTYVGDHFRHHNPYFRGDAKSLASAMEANAAQNPRKTLHVERALEDGDLVAIHSRVRLKPEAPEVATVHIFRFMRGRVVELWDVGQPAPESSPNENGMF